MSLEYKSSVRENITNIQTYIVDESQKSTKYFRVSDVPQVLQKGKNLLRITAHPTNLVPDTQIYVDVRDSNGNAIYYEIPDYLENDKSRVISIWIYHDKGDDNTPNGEATITLAGIANVDMDGNPLPQRHRGKLNVKWQTTVSVDRDRNNTSEIIFSPTITPTLIVSQSTEQYQNQPQSGDILSLTTQTGKVQYIFKGKTPIVEIKDSSTLNGEMIGGSIILNNFTKPAEPIANIENPLSSTFFSSSIKEVLTNKVLKPITNFTTSFANRDDLTHTFDFVGEADYKIEYVQSGSNVSTQNKRNFVNITLGNIDPITGVVNKIKILHKSEGLPGDFELLNEVEVPFSSSVSIKVPIPSKNLKDPKILKLLYLNSDGGISRTQTISNPFVFDGDNIYIGGEENLISGSIFISNTLGTGIEIGGASSGFMRSVGYRGITSASLGKAPGGFVIYSGSGNLVFGEDPLLGVGMQFVGDNDERHLVFSTANGGILDVKTDKFFIGNLNQQYISGSDGNIEISSSIFHLDPKANGGAGSLVIGANATINADLTVDNLRTPASIGGQASTKANSSSSIDSDGFARFVSASIGGWGITTSSIEGGNLIMKPEGILQTRDFASGLKGWKISSEGNGTAEFENVRIRGTLRTTTFEKESVNAVGGQLWVANSTTITGSVTAGETTMSVKNASGFSAGEILLAKKVDNTGFQTEYILLESASVEGDNSNEDETYGRIYVQRAYGSGQQGDFVGDLASSAQAYEDGQVIVSTGKLNTGYIKMNANPNDTATPYMDIVERTGSGLYDVALKVRLGDLSGLANSDYVFGNSNPGFGLATDNVFLQGGIIAKTGSIGGIKMDDGKLFTGAGTYNNSNTGFYVDSGSNFSLGSKLAWNPTTEALTVRGSFQFADGTSVQTAIDNVSSGSVARTVELSADKYVVTFDESGNESPSNQTITLTATPQNFVGQVYYEYYKDSTIQGTRGTANTFTVDTTAEKPTSSTPKTYEVRAFTGSSGGTAASTDSLTLFGLQPGSDGVAGTDAVTAFLTNESHTLPLSSSGVIQSYAGADTQIKVYEGITDKTSNYTFTESSPAYITATSSSNTFTITNTTTPYSGSVTITAVSESVSLSKIMSIGITRQGDDGSAGTPGANAKTITLTTDSQIFSFPSASATTPDDTTIEFFINQQNLSGTIGSSDITIIDNTPNTHTIPTLVSDVTNGTGVISGSLVFSTNTPSNKTKFPITISVTKDGVTDSTKIFTLDGGTDGVDAVSVILSNESHTLPASSAGVVSSYSNSGTNIDVFEGATALTYDTNATSNGQWKVAGTVVSPSGKITVGATDSNGDIANHSSMDNSTDSVTITYTISGKTLNGTAFSFNKTQSISKSSAGSDGTPGASAKTLSVTADSQIFTFSSASNTTVPDDNTIEFFFSQQNLSGTIGDSDIVVTDQSGGVITSNPTLSPSSLSGGSGVVSGSYVFATNLANDSGKFPCTVTVTKDGLTDSFKVFAISGGTDGVSSLQYLLSNEAHIVPATSAGVVSSYVNSDTEIHVYEGTTALSYDGVGTGNGKWKVNTPTISPAGKITVGVLQDEGDYLLVKNHSAMDNSTDSVTISYPIVGKTTDGTSFSFTKTQTITKSKEGSDGLPGTSASLISLTGDSQVFAFASASATTPDDTTIELFITQQNLGITLTASDIRIEDAIGGSHTVPTFAPTSLPNNSGVISGSLVFGTNSPSPKSKFPITITATSASLSDSFKIFALDGGADGTSGTDAITVIVSNESHTLAANSNGDVSSFVGAETDVTIFEGVTDKTTNYFINGVSNTGITVDNDFNSFNSSSLNVTAMSHDSGSVIITSVSGGIHHTGWGARAGENWATSQFVSNATGDINGTDNDWVKIDNGAFEVSIGSGDGELRNNYVEFGNNANNDQAWIAGKDIFAYDDSKTYYIEARFKRVVGSGNVYIGVNGWSNETTKRNKAGSNSFGSQHYIAANGFSFNDGQGTDWITLRGYFSGHSSTANNNTGEAPDINTPKSIHTNATYISPMFLCTYPEATGTVRLDYIEIKEVKDGSGNLSTGTVKVDKTMSLVKSRAGTDGAPGAAGSGSKTVSLTAATNVVTYNAAGGSPSPSSTIALSANSQNFTDGYFKFTGDGITDETSYTNGASANGDTKNFTVPSSYFSSPKTIRVGVSEANQTELAFDTVTIVAVQPGAVGAAGSDAVTAFLTSEADVIPAAADGTVSSFAGSGTTMVVFEGITDKTSAYTYTLINTTTGLTATLSTNVLSISGLTPDSGSTDIRATSGSVTLEKTYSIGKSKAGATGANNQDFSYLDASLTGIGPISSPGLLMNSEVFGFHNGISGTNGSLSDFTSFLDDSGNFYLGGNSGGMSGSAATSGYFAWNNTDRSLLISGSNANIEVDKFFLGTEGSQFISGSGGNIRISGDVEFEGRNSNGATVYYDNFASYANGAAVIPANSPQVDGSGVGYYTSGAGEITTINTPSNVGGYSGKVIRIGNNSGNDYAYITGNKLIPFNESSLYEVEVRYKIEIGSGTVYAGIVGFKSDGTTLVNVTGLNTLSSQHYLAVSGQGSSVSGNGWVIRKGYFKGTSASGNGGQHNSDTDPGTLHSDVLNGYITPMFAGNYNNVSGKVLLDYIKITEIGGGGSTKISGDSITTGTIKSNNLTTDTGTSLGLNDGVMKIGGTGAYTTQNGILLDGPNAKFAVGIASGNYMRFNHGATAGKLEINTPNFTIDNSGNVAVSGNITVSNPSDFADPNATATLNYSFTGNGSQTLDTGIWTLRNISGQSASTSGIRLARGTSPSNNWDGGIRTINEYPRSESPTLTFDWTQQTPSGVTTSNSGITMIGWWTGTTNTFTNKMYYGIYVYHDNIYARTAISAAGSLTPTLITDNAPGDKWRCKIRLKAGGGAMLELFRNGDFITPAATYDYGTTGTLANLGFGLCQYKAGNSDLLLEQVAIGSQPATTTISGNGISTGLIESTNLDGDEGSRINLDDGSMIMGGTTNPGFEVSSEGFVTATNIVEKFVTVTAANSGSYYQTNSGHTTLVLDGSLGGSVTMNLTLATAPPYVINDITFPANAGSDDIARLELSIQDDGIQFDDGAITSGYTTFGLQLQTYYFNSRSTL
jgi:hypothetical protein